MKPIRIECSTPQCASYQVIHHDDMIPKHWLCSECESALAEQMLNDLDRRERVRVRAREFYQEAR